MQEDKKEESDTNTESQPMEYSVRCTTYPSLEPCAATTTAEDYLYCYFERVVDNEPDTTKITSITFQKPPSYYISDSEQDVVYSWCWWVSNNPTHSGWTRIDAFPADIKELFVLQKDESSMGEAQTFSCRIFADVDRICDYVAHVWRDFDQNRCYNCEPTEERRKREAMEIMCDLRKDAQCKFGECNVDYYFAFYKLPIC